MAISPREASAASAAEYTVRQFELFLRSAHEAWNQVDQAWFSRPQRKHNATTSQLSAPNIIPRSTGDGIIGKITSFKYNFTENTPEG